MAFSHQLEKYQGVKFVSKCRSQVLHAAARLAHGSLFACGVRLTRYRLTPGASGNMSVRVPEGIVITSSGADLGDLREHEMVLVHDCDEVQEQVVYTGLRLPSSEVFMHWIIYDKLPSAGAVAHAHGDLGVAARTGTYVFQTPREEPYGTLALAELAAASMAVSPQKSLIILKNHGYLAVGANLFQAVDALVDIRLKLRS